MTKVRCHVNTCTHWLKGMCGAGNIDILNEEEGRMSNIAEQTECKTFYKADGATDYLGSMDNVSWGGMTSSLLGGDMSPAVTCTVNTCRYWSNGNECHADLIEVTGSHASECQDTNCQTFEDKDGAK